MATARPRRDSGSSDTGTITETVSATTGVRTAKCHFCQRAYSGEVVAKNLKCGHAVCSLCLAMNFQDRQIKCPLCQEITNAKSVDEFTTNFELQNLIDQLNQVKISAGNEPASGAAAAGASVKQEPRQITIKLLDQEGTQIEFRMNYSGKLGRVMNQYAARKGMPVKSLKFSFDGVRVKEDHTPESFEMADGEIIEVFHETEGGCN